MEMPTHRTHKDILPPGLYDLGIIRHGPRWYGARMQGTLHMCRLFIHGSLQNRDLSLLGQYGTQLHAVLSTS